MGREVRRVPPHWVQPVWTKDDAPRPELVGRERSFYPDHIETALADWLKTFDRIRRGDLQDYESKYYSGPAGLAHWLQDERGPDPAYYRPWKDEEATWVQLWQTVSEGTPVSPAFATEEELIQYLAVNGDFWDQNRDRNTVQRRMKGWGEERARAFVKAGWSPSMAVMDGQVLDSKDIPLAMGKTNAAH